MVKVKPFAAIRPPKAFAAEVASRPYDVLNSVEAKAEAGEKSLLHIIKPEIDFDPIRRLMTKLLRTSNYGKRKAGWFKTLKRTTMFMHRPWTAELNTAL